MSIFRTRKVPLHWEKENYFLPKKRTGNKPTQSAGIKNSEVQKNLINFKELTFTVTMVHCFNNPYFNIYFLSSRLKNKFVKREEK